MLTIPEPPSLPGTWEEASSQCINQNWPPATLPHLFSPPSPPTVCLVYIPFGEPPKEATRVFLVPQPTNQPIHTVWIFLISSFRKGGGKKELPLVLSSTMLWCYTIWLHKTCSPLRKGNHTTCTAIWKIIKCVREVHITKITSRKLSIRPPSPDPHPPPTKEHKQGACKGLGVHVVC